jgi:hypothetical protein
VRLALVVGAWAGVLTPACCLAAPPALTDDRLGIGTAPLLLLSRPDVRAEIGLDADQGADADRALSALYEQAVALRGQRGPDADNRKRAIDDAGEEWLQSRLSESQRKRFSQLDLQWEGASALIRRPVVADHLGLTADQRTRLAEAIAVRNRRRAAGDDLWECERRLFEQARALLSAEQQERWRAMLGPPFQFVRKTLDPRTPGQPQPPR